MPDVYDRRRKMSNKDQKDKKRDVVSDVMVDEAKKLHKEAGFANWWGSLSVCPNKTSFETQGNKEKIILLMRRHLVTNLWWVALSCFLIFVPFVWREFPLVAVLSTKTVFSLTVLWYLGLAFFVLENLLLWFYNIYIVTDERIVDVDFFGLLYKNVNVAQIRKIEDVNYSQLGILANIFNFGDVVMETASEQLSAEVKDEGSAFTFQAVINPNRVVRVIGELIEQEEEEEYEGRVR